MEATRARRLAPAFGVSVSVFVFGFVFAAQGDEPAGPAPAAVPVPTSTSAAPGDPTAQASPAKPASTDPADRTAARAAVVERLKTLGLDDKDAPAASKALREVFEARLDWIKESEKAARALREAEHPDPSPDRQASDWKADLERVRARLDQSAKDPELLLPDAFRNVTAQDSDAARVEMKAALDAAQDELKDWKAKLEAVRADSTRKGGNTLAALRVERDKCHQRVADLKPRAIEREAATAAARTPEAAELARERLVNYDWETRVAAEKLRALEAQLALETRRADLVEPQIQWLDAHVALASRSLERMQARYRSIAARQERDLKRLADDAQKRAAKADDPLERYRAQRSAELLELEARAVKDENALATSPPPSFEEQKGLADRAVDDFAGLKSLLDDGRVSHLDALRLNNEFRRIGPERAKIVARDLAAVNNQLTYYGNALSAVELELINDARDDRLELDRVLELLPKARHAEANARFTEIESKHEQLLTRRRVALEKLANRGEQTHDQVLRRLRTLDDQYGFIRTHIFWVRDEEPIGATTLGQVRREALGVGKALGRLALEACDRSLWGRVSAEFVAALLAMVILPWPLLRLSRVLDVLSHEPRRTASRLADLRGLLIGFGRSAVGPAYLGLVAYLVRQGPWPRGLGMLAASALVVLAATGVATNLARWAFRPSGWAETILGVPADVARQARRSLLVLATAGVVLLLPEWLLDSALIAPGGRPVSAASLGRMLILGFELTAWHVAYRLVRHRSPMAEWLKQMPAGLGWLDRHQRRACWSAFAAIGGVIALDAVGYRFTARRLAIGAGQSLILLGLCWGLYKAILRAIDHHAWRWIKAGPSSTTATGQTPADSGQPDDLADRLRRLAAYLVPALGLVLGAWNWGVDWALFRFLGEQPLWLVDAKNKEVYVTVGDFAEFALILGLCAIAWRHMSTFFAVAVFPRMRDDPGVRFAVLTLCRYAVLGVGLLAGLSSIHLGLEKIGVVLAALGVGLGFGLQEIVSNFVCGIILLLERPIRVGDVVTVSNMTGKVDRINIRATTITNGDNQSIIVPNRAFITSDLINWTLRDKVIRVSIRVKAAHGTDPDRVSELLLNIAREDSDVLRNPLPSSYLEEFGESGLNFALHVHVPEPSLAARVRHRLLAQIQRRFEGADIAIPLPSQELYLKPMMAQPSAVDALSRAFGRVDPPAPTPPPVHLNPDPQRIPAPVEDCHRGVDE